MKTRILNKKKVIDKEKVGFKIMEIIKEANKTNVLATNDFIYIEGRKYEELLTIWTSSKIVTDLVKEGLIIKNRLGNKYYYEMGEIKPKEIISDKDKYLTIIKKCHQIEENVLKLIIVENDGVKDLSDIVNELNSVVEKLN